ncbi:MAG: PHP domain-containing protein [Candidatus Micrarchaeia archaeon]
MKLDLHIHSIYSDGCCSPEEIASRAKALGLNGFAITDHDTSSGWERGKKAAKVLGLVFVAGKEIVIRKKPKFGEKKGKKIGEILALFLDEDLKIKKEEQTPENVEEIIEQIHERNGIAAIPHPFSGMFRKQNMLQFLSERKIKLDVIESINGRCNAKENGKAIEYATKNKIPQIGGSDAHILREIGSVYTFANVDTIEDYRKAIKKGLGKPIGIQKGVLEINLNRLNGRLLRIIKTK